MTLRVGNTKEKDNSSDYRKKQQNFYAKSHHKLKYKWQTGGNSCNTYNRLMVNSLTNQQGKMGRAKEKHTKNIKIKQAKRDYKYRNRGGNVQSS